MKSEWFWCRKGVGGAPQRIVGRFTNEFLLSSGAGAATYVLTILRLFLFGGVRNLVDDGANNDAWQYR